MVDKKKNFLTRGEEAQREREEALKEYSRAERDAQRKLDELDRGRRRAEQEGDLTSASEYTAAIESQLAEIMPLAKTRLESTEKLYRRSVRTALGGRAIREDVARYAHGTESYGAASRLAAGPTRSIQDQIDEAQLQRQVLSAEILKESRGLATGSTPEKLTSLGDKWRRLESLAEQEGVAKAGLAIQRRQGSDIVSVFESSATALAKQDKLKVVQDVQAGRAGKASEINERFDKSVKDLSESFSKLQEILHKTAVTEEEVAEKKKKQADAEDALKTSKAAFDKAKIEKEAAIDMGGGGGRWGQAGRAVSDAGVILQAGGSMWRQWNVTQEMDRTKLQTGYMEIANRRFMDQFAASQGDASALARITGGQHQRGAAFAKEMGKQEVRAAAAEGIGSGLVAAGALIVGGAALSATGGGAIAGIPMLLGGLGLLASQAGNIDKTSGQAAKLASGATRAAQELQAYDADEALFDAQNRMRAFVNQNAIDYVRNARLTTRGAGGQRDTVAQQIRGADFQYLMAGLEIDQSGILSLTQSGIGALGKRFRGRDDIERAGQLTQMGLLSNPEEYMGMRAIAEKSGVGAKGLEDILEKAVKAGLDSSKNISEMLQGIDRMTVTRGGVTTFGGAAENMALSVQGFRAAGMSENMAVQAAMDLNQTFNRAASSTALTVPNVIEWNALMQQLPGFNMREIQAVAKLTPDQYRMISKELEQGTGKIGEPGFRQETANVLGDFGIPYRITKGQLDAAWKESGKQSIRTVIGYGWDKGMQKKWEDVVTGATPAPEVNSAEYNEMRSYWNSLVKSEDAKLPAGVPLTQVRDKFDAAAKAAGGGFDTTLMPTDTPTQRYKKVIAKNESGGAYSVRSSSDKSSAYGRYQITKGTANALGFDYDKMVKLGDTPEGRLYQERVMDKLMEDQKKSVAHLRFSRPAATKGYTDAEMMALVHYAGPDNLNAWLTSEGRVDWTKKDPTNPGIAGYLKKFREQYGEGSGEIGGEEDVGDPGRGILTAGAKGLVTAYEEGLKDLTTNVKAMSDAANKISPDNFKKVIDESAGVLGGTLDKLNEAVDDLNSTVVLLNNATKTRLQTGNDEQE